MGTRPETSRLSQRVSQRVVAARLRRGMTQAEVAKKLHLKVQAYGSYERFATNPKTETPISVERLEQIARVLELPMAYFLDAKEDKPTLDDEAARVWNKLSEEHKQQAFLVMRILAGEIK